MTDDDGSELVLVSAAVSIRDIKLDLPLDLTCADVEDLLVGAYCELNDDAATTEDDSPEGLAVIVIPGPFQVDLVTGAATPSLDQVVIPAASYRRIDFRVDDGDEELSFTATVELPGTESTTVSMMFDFNEDIRIESAEGVAVDSDTDLIAEFVVDNWLAGASIGACLDDGDVTRDGAIWVVTSESGGSCSEVEDSIRTNMKESGRLNHD